MSERPERLDLLPDHATPRERALAGTDGRFEDIDADRVRRIGGPAVGDVPADYLPQRAWGASVDVWDPDWPEAVRRDVIAFAPEVHRYKGTPRSVTRALAALRVSTRMTEWHETTPRGRPYTFSVVALARSRLYGGSPVLDERVVRAIHATVMRVKPLSRAFDLAVGIELTAEPTLAAAGVGVLLDGHIAEAGPATDFAADMSVAAAGVGLLLDHRVADAGPATGFAAEPALAAAGVGLLLDHHLAEAGPATAFAAGPGLAAVGTAFLLLFVTAEAA
ncbi:phage tail protein I [uncultured Methylobacterium sp.]|jgi:phage tail P2-like protein|uniref:phage tail protein I n=1 Tax=uncultured Methylobacterium sp. TaxID=157278 RepID=UPI00263402E8|nr:phage tail protein I [uncultured Methylobacterium sp.]